MELQPAEKIMEEIMKRYDKNPRGWRVYVGKGAGGYQNLLFAHDTGSGSQLFQIKQHYLSPYKTLGLGARMEGKQLPIAESQEFGLRPVPENEVLELFDEKLSLKILGEILSRNPVSISDASKASSLLSGPIIHVNQPSFFISKEQEELDLRLRLELEKLLWKHYPERMRLSV
ncbi:MAG: hypothetical protein JTT11_02460 [Candidatus Brockarchaeota archaeon]|nr:hypothetical protein [Candidatus Brockarchaeota archaeon]